MSRFAEIDMYLQK